MYELFDRDKTYKTPSGDVLTGADMISSDEYPDMSEGNWILNISNNMIFSISPLEQLAINFGVDISEDLDGVVDQINENYKQKTKSEAIINQYMPSIMMAARFAAVGFTDEQALEVRDLYPAFEIGHAYKKDERFTYNGHLFKVNQDHTSQKQWVPRETGTESLYTSLEMGDNGYLNWQQPTGSHDAYNTGDIVNYKGELYKSLIDGNAWAPDVYPAGWEKYTEPTS